MTTPSRWCARSQAGGGGGGSVLGGDDDFVVVGSYSGTSSAGSYEASFWTSIYL